MRKVINVSVEALFGAIEVSIQNGDVDLYNRLSQSLPLNTLTGEQADDLLVNFLTYASYYNRTEFVKPIMSTWEIVYPNIEDLPMYAWMYTNYKFSEELLLFIAKAHPSYSFSEICSDFIGWEDSDNTTLACKKAHDIYGAKGEYALEEYLKLRQEANASNNTAVYNFINNIVRKVGKFTPIPEWVNNDDKEFPEIPNAIDIFPEEEKDFKYVLPPLAEIASSYAKGAAAKGASVEEIKDIRDEIIRELLGMTFEEKLEFYKPMLDYNREAEKQKDTRLFRILGPPNLSPIKTDIKYGGCRMFTCDTYDQDEETDAVEEWFQGYCEQCNNRIRRKWHAVRMPRATALAGWMGCYCNWDCCRMAVDVVLDQGQDITLELIDIYEKKIKEIGIQERIPHDKFPEMVWGIDMEEHIKFLEERD